jgi:serine/threonine protein kinase
MCMRAYPAPVLMDVAAIAQALAIAVRLVSALQYIHGKGILYRDLKPENVILADRGLIKLVRR